LGDKPRFEAERFGVMDMVKCRAVKVKLTNRNSVFDLLKKSIDLTSKNDKMRFKVPLAKLNKAKHNFVSKSTEVWNDI
jgi:hypothetical protein